MSDEIPGDGMEIPAAESRSGIATWRSYDVNECKVCGIEFEDDDVHSDRGALRDHLAAEHPRQCGKLSCSNMATYIRAGGGWTHRYYCADCLAAKDDIRPLSDWTLVTIQANDPAPRLPDNHPVEKGIRGLYGDSDD